jgi:hypothetical protein
MVSPTKSASARIASKNVNKPKTPKSAQAAKATRERERGKSRVDAKTERDARIMLNDSEVADVLQSPVHRSTFGSDGTSTIKRKLRGMPDNESASNRGRHNHATSPAIAPRRSDRQKGLGTSATVPQDDDALIETEPRQVR